MIYVLDLKILLVYVREAKSFLRAIKKKFK